jgi:hypothetical protein
MNFLKKQQKYFKNENFFRFTCSITGVLHAFVLRTFKNCQNVLEQLRTNRDGYDCQPTNTSENLQPVWRKKGFYNERFFDDRLRQILIQ